MQKNRQNVGRKLVNILLGNKTVQVQFPSSIKFNSFLNNYYNDSLDEDLNINTNGVYGCIIDVTKINAIWHNREDLNNTKKSYGLYYVEVFFEEVTFGFHVVGGSRVKSVYNTLSKMVSATPNGEIIGFNQEENKKCYVRFNNVIHGVRFDTITVEAKSSKKIVITNGYC